MLTGEIKIRITKLISHNGQARWYATLCSVTLTHGCCNSWRTFSTYVCRYPLYRPTDDIGGLRAALSGRVFLLPLWMPPLSIRGTRSLVLYECHSPQLICRIGYPFVLMLNHLCMFCAVYKADDLFMSSSCGAYCLHVLVPHLTLHGLTSCIALGC